MSPRRVVHAPPPPPPPCVDCGSPSSVWRDVARGIGSCRPCEIRARASRDLANIGPPDGFKRTRGEINAERLLLVVGRPVVLSSMRPTDPAEEAVWLARVRADHTQTAQENGEMSCRCATCDDARASLTPARVLSTLRGILS